MSVNYVIRVYWSVYVVPHVASIRQRDKEEPERRWREKTSNHVNKNWIFSLLGVNWQCVVRTGPSWDITLIVLFKINV